MNSEDCGANTPNQSKSPPRRAELVEVGAAMDKLTERELRELEKYASEKTSYGVQKGEGEDVLNEVVVSTLMGKRHWYIDLNPTMFEHLRWEIKTFAYERRHKLLTRDKQTETKVPITIVADPSEDDVFSTGRSSVNVDVENEYDNTQGVKRIYEFFFDDPTISEMLECLALKYSKSRIIEELGLTDTEYANAKKRIERKREKMARLISMKKK